MPITDIKAAARPLKPYIQPALTWLEHQQMPPSAKAMRKRDLSGSDRPDHGAEATMRAALDWLLVAQKHSATNDDGAARDYSHTTGWAASYPETSGYIVPTMLTQAERLDDAALRDGARRMLDWLVAIQFDDGGFQGGTIGQVPRVPVTFNTGQILMGLAAGTQVFGEDYAPAMRKAADWLVQTQDADGCWRAHRTPFATPDDKAYETHVSWGLLEAARVEANADWSGAALRQVDWALTKQQANGWMSECCLSRPDAPLTHTLGYALRGIVEAYTFSKRDEYLEAAQKLGGAMVGCQGEDGYLCGRLDAAWRDSADWVCLTGTAQVAHCWLMLSEIDNARGYREAAGRALGYLRRRIDIDGPEETRGAVAGSFPIHGDYVPYGYPNWAAKFYVDAQQLANDLGVE